MRHCYDAPEHNPPMESESPKVGDALVPLHKVEASVSLLKDAIVRFKRVVYSSSMGVEAMVLTDLIHVSALPIDIFTVDTGRMPEATLALIERVERRYQKSIRVVYPEAQAVQNFVADHGINGFYRGLEQRQRCCYVRKVEPFRRAVAGYGAWVTGVRHEQSELRAETLAVERDHRYGLYKVSPLLNWTQKEIWAYVRAHDLPYNPMHDHGYPSIGCAPCTRPVEPGESERAGRWSWESPGSRECGLQPRPPDSLSDL
jgi:phosphoadenosine phosphosulfate reductase